MPVFYLPQGREVDVCKHAWAAQLPLMVKGPTGCGKTRFIQHMAEMLSRPLVTVSCNEDTSATDWCRVWGPCGVIDHSVPLHATRVLLMTCKPVDGVDADARLFTIAKMSCNSM